MKKMLVFLALLFLASCQATQTVDPTTRFVGTWSGSDANGYMTYTFNSTRTFTETYSGNLVSNYSGTWDVSPTFLKLDYSTGFITQCYYSFSTFNGKTELQLGFSTVTQSLIKQ